MGNCHHAAARALRMHGGRSFAHLPRRRICTAEHLRQSVRSGLNPEVRTCQVRLSCALAALFLHVRWSADLGLGIIWDFEAACAHTCGSHLRRSVIFEWCSCFIVNIMSFPCTQLNICCRAPVPLQGQTELIQRVLEALQARAFPHRSLRDIKFHSFCWEPPWFYFVDVLAAGVNFLLACSSVVWCDATCPWLAARSANYQYKISCRLMRFLAILADHFSRIYRSSRKSPSFLRMPMSSNGLGIC